MANEVNQVGRLTGLHDGDFAFDDIMAESWSIGQRCQDCPVKVMPEWIFSGIFGFTVKYGL